jgi:hypothetical protein
MRSAAAPAEANSGSDRAVPAEERDYVRDSSRDGCRSDDYSCMLPPSAAFNPDLLP